jgi:hypothetical protein
MPNDPKFLRVRPRGFSPDADPSTGEHWFEGANILDRDGGALFPRVDADIASSTSGTIASPLFGVSGTNPTAAAAPERINTAKNYLAGFDGAAGKLWVFDPVTYFDITPAAWAKVGANEYSGGMLNSYLYMANGNDAPVTHDWVNANAATVLAGWPANTAPRWIASFRDFLIVGDITETVPTAFYENQIRWSDRAPTAGGLPTAWASTATNEAGDAFIGDTGEVVFGLSLADEFLIYKRGSIWRMREVGLPTVFAISRGIASEGLISRNAVVEMDSVHYCIGENDIYRTNGREAKSIANQTIRRFFLDEVIEGRRSECYAFFNHLHREVWFCFPVNTGADYCDTALIYDGSRWSIRDLDGAAGITSEGYPHIFSGTQQLVKRMKPLGVDPAAANDEEKQRIIEGAAESVSNGFSVMVEPLPGRQSIVRRIWPILQGVPKGLSLSWRVYGLDTINDRETVPTVPVQNWSQGVPISCDARGRYIVIETIAQGNLTDTADGQLFGFDIEFTAGGRR